MGMCQEAREAEGMAGNSHQGAASRRAPLTKHEMTVYAVEMRAEVCWSWS